MWTWSTLDGTAARKSRRLPTAAAVIAVCDELLARFGTATELPRRELFANTESRNERRHAAAAEMRRFSPSLLTSGPFCSRIALTPRNGGRFFSVSVSKVDCSGCP